VIGSYQDTLQMTTQFKLDPDSVEGVWSDFRKHVSPLFSDDKSDGGGFFKTVITAEEIVKILSLRSNFDSSKSSLMRTFISNSSQKGYLTKWHLIVKTTGKASGKIGKGKIYSSESGLPGDVIMGIRNGPKKHLDRDTLLQKGIFQATGKSANIMTAPDDMAVPLTKAQINTAREKYETFMRKKLHREFPDWTEDDVEQEVRKKLERPPERIYREALNETQGVLIIYLFDTHYVFKPNGVDGDHEYQNFVKAHNLNLNIPLVGYALGFPPIKGSVGDDYVVRDDYESEDVPYDEQDLPPDALEDPLS